MKQNTLASFLISFSNTRWHATCLINREMLQSYIIYQLLCFQFSFFDKITNLFSDTERDIMLCISFHRHHCSYIPTPLVYTILSCPVLYYYYPAAAWNIIYIFFIFFVTTLLLFLFNIKTFIIIIHYHSLPVILFIILNIPK